MILFFTNREKVSEHHEGLVFYDNSDLNIAKSKKSEQYIMRISMNTLLAIVKVTDTRHDVSTDKRIEPPISLEIAPFLVLLFKRYSFRIFFYPMILSTMVLILTYATDINIIKENKGRCKESTIRGHRKNLSPRWDSMGFEPTTHLEHGGSWVRIPSWAQIFSVSSYG